MNPEDKNAQAQQLAPIDVLAHNAVFAIVQLQGRLLAEREREYNNLAQRTQAILSENAALRTKIAELSKAGARATGEA